MKTFNWLTQDEQNILLAINPRAEKIVNRLGIDMTEEKLFPFTPVGTHVQQQGNNEPKPYGKHEVISKQGSGIMQIFCPQDSSFSKYERRRGWLCRVRKNYFNPEWERMILACMKPALRKLNWSIYTASNGVFHIYLNCVLPAHNGGSHVSLYVPTEYFGKKDWSIVEDFHNRVAVGYYKGSGFRVSQEQLVEWQNQTAAALTCKEAKSLRKIVE